MIIIKYLHTHYSLFKREGVEEGESGTERRGVRGRGREGESQSLPPSPNRIYTPLVSRVSYKIIILHSIILFQLMNFCVAHEFFDR